MRLPTFSNGSDIFFLSHIISYCILEEIKYHRITHYSILTNSILYTRIIFLLSSSDGNGVDTQ